MVKKEVIEVKKKHLIVIGAVLVGLISIVLAFNGSSRETITEVRPASYDYLEEIVGKSAYKININEGEYQFVEGAKTRVYSYNGQIPGPLIKGDLGEVITVEVVNNLEEPTTIHWHGLILNNQNDGVPQVTQEPILPGEKYTYEIELRNPGLFWYHSHVEAHKQVESGLYGSILVEDEKSIDGGNILVLDDALLGNDYQFRDFNLGVMHGRFGNHYLVNGEVDPTMALNNNRLRIVNTANARSFNLNFGDLPFTVVGMDIGESDTYDGSVLSIHPGERYDILLDIERGQEITLSHLTSRRSYQLARLSMDGEKIDETYFSEFSVPFSPEEMASKDPDFNAELVGFRGGPKGIIWSINEKYFPDTTEVFEASEGDMVKIRLKNLQGQPHPMHLHGQKFVVLARNGVIEENLGWKDTVMVGNREEVDIVFVAEEKGEWVFHCHILEHAEAGMLSLLRVI